jgi:hypothetical protein
MRRCATTLGVLALSATEGVLAAAMLDRAKSNHPLEHRPETVYRLE